MSNLFAKANLCLKFRDFCPSTPAVLFPAFSCVTCQTASNLAAEDFRISFCRFFARTLSFSRMALNSLVCNRKRFLWSFFQGSFCQSSLKLISCLTMIYVLDHFLITSRQLRLVLPEIKGFGVSSHLPGFSTFPKTFIPFLFVPTVRFLAIFRANHFAHLPLEGYSYHSNNTVRVANQLGHLDSD